MNKYHKKISAFSLRHWKENIYIFCITKNGITKSEQIRQNKMYEGRKEMPKMWEKRKSKKWIHDININNYTSIKVANVITQVAGMVTLIVSYY